jgi:nucleotide-binding universal stress UspA family protein
MHVLIATTGVLTPGPVVQFTASLLGTTGRVTVTTVIEVPRSFLEDLTSEDWHPLSGSDVFPDDRKQEEMITRYVEERGRRLTDPIVAALHSEGITATTRFLEGEDPAVAIPGLAEAIDADLVILGATRQIFDQSAWESVSARIMIESGRPILVVPPPQKSDEPEPTEELADAG